MTRKYDNMKRVIFYFQTILISFWQPLLNILSVEKLVWIRDIDFNLHLKLKFTKKKGKKKIA